MKTNPSFITLALTSVTIPASKTGHYRETQQVVGIAMLIAERNADDTWCFELKWNVTPPGTKEEPLLLWLTRALPDSGILIGWQLGDQIVDPLLDAALDSDPDIARAFLDRLTKLATGASVDLAIAHGGENASSLREVAVQHGIDLTPLSKVQIESAWACSDLDALRDDVRAQMVAAWQLWVAQSNGAADAVNRSFGAWFAE